MRARTVCFGSFFSPEIGDPERFLAETPLLRELPVRMAARGYAVHVVQSFASDAHIRRGGVDYHFVRTHSRASAGSSTWRRLSRQLPAVRAVRKIRLLQPDIVHWHGSSLYLNHLLVRRALPEASFILQYHGGLPSPNPFARRLQRTAFARTQRFLFTTREHAAPFIEAGLIDDEASVSEFMETSSDFAPADREAARAATGMEGQPVFLSTARLDAIKDPLTTLRGFERIAQIWPSARLHMFYTDAPLLRDVQGFIQSRSDLRGRVLLRGRAPLEQMPLIYNSADFLLQASRREYSGCAVLEAMACGVIPIVTDIPSFRAMTGDGRLGGLFPPGDCEALARSAVASSLACLPLHRARVREHFEAALSFDVLAARLDDIYRNAFERVATSTTVAA